VTDQLNTSHSPCKRMSVQSAAKIITRELKLQRRVPSQQAVPITPTNLTQINSQLNLSLLPLHLQNNRTKFANKTILPPGFQVKNQARARVNSPPPLPPRTTTAPRSLPQVDTSVPSRAVVLLHSTQLHSGKALQEATQSARLRRSSASPVPPNALSSPARAPSLFTTLSARPALLSRDGRRLSRDSERSSGKKQSSLRSFFPFRPFFQKNKRNQLVTHGREPSTCGSVGGNDEFVILVLVWFEGEECRCCCCCVASL